MIDTRRQAESIAGTLSKPGKMPCHAISIPATECITGSKLVKVPDSVCHGCYALKGNYRFRNVQDAMQRRLDGIDHQAWVDAMVWLILDANEGYFRWHDSGDVQGLDHLRKIIEVAKRTPNVKHWIPTREYRIVQTYRKLYGEFPANIVVRLSAHMVDKDPPSAMGLPTSTVVRTGYTCPAPDQGNKCQDCRACWDPEVPNVSYSLH